MRPALFLLAFVACATPPPSGLRVEPVRLDAPSRGLRWRADAEEALNEARLSRRGALVYFVVPGDDECRRMDRETMTQPRVRGLGTRMMAIRANVDETAQRDLFGTYAPQGDRPVVPAFALFGPDGTVVARWTGVWGADAFSAHVNKALRESAIPRPWAEPWVHAMARLWNDDIVPLRELVAKLDRAGEQRLAARLALAECRDCFYRYQWAGAVDAADRFAKRFPGHPATQEVADLRGRALFRGSGERAPDLLKRVAEHIDELGVSAPLFGGADYRAKWAGARTWAEDSLVAIGEPAADALLAAVLERQGSIAEPCARALGRIRYSRLMPDVIDALRDTSLRFPVRARIVIVMNAWADPGFLTPLIEVLGNPREAAIVRIAAAAAIARLGSSHGGLYGPLVVSPILGALESRNVDLRRETLKALDAVTEPFDLERLYPAMKDRRASGLDEQSISDLACSLFLRRAGARLVNAEGKSLDDFPRDAPKVIRQWWEANQHLLRWETAQSRYVLTR